MNLRTITITIICMVIVIISVVVAINSLHKEDHVALRCNCDYQALPKGESMMVWSKNTDSKLLHRMIELWSEELEPNTARDSVFTHRRDLTK